jgi:hypothetical protein
LIARQIDHYHCTLTIDRNLDYFFFFAFLVSPFFIALFIAFFLVLFCSQIFVIVIASPIRRFIDIVYFASYTTRHTVLGVDGSIATWWSEK